MDCGNSDMPCQVSAMKKGDNLLLKAFGVDAPSELVFWSFRYFLGRMTIHASAFARDLARAWPHLDKRIKKLIQSELEDEFRLDDEARAAKDKCFPLGHDFHRAAWEKVREAYAMPSYLCSGCAKARGWRWPKGHMATMHGGKCDVCREEKSLSCENDWLKPGQRKIKPGGWD